MFTLLLTSSVKMHAAFESLTSIAYRLGITQIGKIACQKDQSRHSNSV